MPAHDWTLVEAGIFHGFYLMWISRLNATMNGGLLPAGYYALPEQHTGSSIADVLALHGTPVGGRASSGPAERTPASGGGAVAVAELPPRVKGRQTLRPTPLALRRTLAIRHVSGDRLVAMVELVSPANKDRPRSVTQFAEKAASALEAGVSLLLLDLFPPVSADPDGMYIAVRDQLALVGGDPPNGRPGDPDPGLPTDAEPLMLAAMAAGDPVEAFLERVAIGSPLPPMPLFLDPDRYVNVPLESTYRAAFAEMPPQYRVLLETSLPDGQ